MVAAIAIGITIAAVVLAAAAVEVAEDELIDSDTIAGDIAPIISTTTLIPLSDVDVDVGSNNNIVGSSSMEQQEGIEVVDGTALWTNDHRVMVACRILSIIHSSMAILSQPPWSIM